MQAAAPYGGGQFLADTSAWTSAHRLTGLHETEWVEALRQRQVVTCHAVVYELGQGARTPHELQVVEENFSALRRLQIERAEWHAALDAIRRLSDFPLGAGYHQGISVVDTLVAVLAERHGFGVLHYDRDFDRLAQRVSFVNQPVAPLGSL